jgi:hypothetical protein
MIVISGTVSSTFALADDQPDNNARSVASNPPPREFAPMTRSERLSRYLLGLSDGESILRAAASAGFAQASNTPKEWKGGAEGYGKRVGNAYAEHVLNRTLQHGIAAALHEDNRYFVSGESAFYPCEVGDCEHFSRTSRQWQPVYLVGPLWGAAGGAFISRQWQPRSTTSAGDGAVSFGVTMGADIGFNLFRELWPGTKRHSR